MSEWAYWRGMNAVERMERARRPVPESFAWIARPADRAPVRACGLANLAAVTIGTETGGSIICPSSINGIVGLKPTVGLWSRAGIIPIPHSQDSAGPMTRTVRDAAILLGVVAA